MCFLCIDSRHTATADKIKINMPTTTVQTRDEKEIKNGKPRFAIVIGTSAGGLNALIELVSHFHPGMDAAVFIVMHLSRSSMGDFLVQRLQHHTELTCVVAVDGEITKAGHIYISPANCHLLVKGNKILIGRGPEENRWRPSIDVLFRSAAAEYNTRCIGIVLTGLLDDGTTGMQAIRRSGGTSIVQDPNEAEYPDMPFSVLDSMEVDHCLPLSAIGEIVSEVVQTSPDEIPAPEDVRIESQIAEKVVVSYDNVKALGEKSIYACPDCGGGLWAINEGGTTAGDNGRYRCHIGHAYSENDLVIKQEEVFESTLWVALRIMEERRNLLNKLQNDHKRKGLTRAAGEYEQKVENIQRHVDALKDIIYASQKSIA